MYLFLSLGEKAAAGEGDKAPPSTTTNGFWQPLVTAFSLLHHHLHTEMTFCITVSPMDGKTRMRK
jgi:hypothetical protein